MKPMCMAAAFAAFAALAPTAISAQPDTTSFSPVAADDKAAALDVLNGYLRPIARSLVIETCSTMLVRHAGTVETIYTAECKLRHGGSVALCGDTGVGEFALTVAPRQVTARSNVPRQRVLIDFANSNCGGG